MSSVRPDNWLYRLLREPVNSLTHLVGALLSAAGLVWLLLRSAGDPWRLTGFAIYGATLVLAYTASTLLHSVRAGPRGYRFLRTFDHGAIFFLIAGTYTPIALVTLQPEHAIWGWSILAVVWALAFLGVVFKVFWMNAPRFLSTGLYLLMGWLALVAIVPIARAMSLGGLVWMALGGLFYSVGAVVYATKRPDILPHIFGYHELWHLFVLAGSLCHFVMMLRYVLPA